MIHSMFVATLYTDTSTVCRDTGHDKNLIYHLPQVVPFLIAGHILY